MAERVKIRCCHGQAVDIDGRIRVTVEMPRGAGNRVDLVIEEIKPLMVARVKCDIDSVGKTA